MSSLIRFCTKIVSPSLFSVGSESLCPPCLKHCSEKQTIEDTETQSFHREAESHILFVRSSLNKAGGFSLLELLIAMAITLTLMTAATTLLASALRVRSRENQKSDALADTQRALNIMSREIANSGFNLNNNGIVALDSGPVSIRIRSNLNRFDYDPSVSDASRTNVQDPGEDITYFINAAANTMYLARHDRFGNGSTVLANRIDSMNIHYFDRKVTYTVPPGGTGISNVSAAEVTPANAKYIVIAIAVTLDAVGIPNAPGYQPPYSVLLCSDVTLRNTGLWSY